MGNKVYSGPIMVLLLLIMAFCGVYLVKNTAYPRQVWQQFFHFMVGQETRLNTAQFQELQTSHYIIKYTQADSDYADMVAETAEKAYDLVSRQMGWQVAQKTTVIVYPDNESLAKSFGWDKDEKAMGVYWGGTIRVLTPRVWLSQPFDQSEFFKDGPMVHEFVHLMVDDRTNGNYNRWWTEGVAQYMEREITGFVFDTPKTVRQDKLYNLSELAKSFDQIDQPTAYWESLQVIELIVDQYGEERLYLIMDYLGQGNSIEKAIEKALGNDFSKFAYQCYQYMEKQ